MDIGCRRVLSIFIFSVFALASTKSEAGRFHRRGCRFIINRLGQKVHRPKLPRVDRIDLDRVQKPIPGIRDSVVAAIVSDGQVLMNLRGGVIGRGQWGVLGGKVDAGETLREALMRELSEEAAIHRVANARIIFVHYHYNFLSREIFRVFVVRAEIDESVIPTIMEPEKILDLKWFDLNEMPSPLFSEFDAYKASLY